MKKGVALIGAKRPFYFEKVLKSIKDGLGDRRLHVFLDFIPEDGGIDLQNKHIDILDNTIGGRPQYVLHAQDQHAGLGKNMIEARRVMFDHYRYDLAFIMEDDLIVPPTYFDFCENIWHWAQENFDNVGMVSGWSDPALWCKKALDRAIRGKKEISWEWMDDRYQNVDKNRYKVDHIQNHFWGYLMSRDVWSQIKHFVYFYEQQFLSYLDKYKDRDHRRINEWKIHCANLAALPQKGEGIRLFPINKQRLASNFNFTISGQDQMTSVALFMAGYLKIAPVLSRGTYIGKIGEHFKGNTWQQYNMDDQKCYASDQDSKQTEFEVYK